MHPGLSRWKRILLGVIVGWGVLVGSGWILVRTLGEHDTRYRGQTLYDWANQARSTDASVSNHAVTMLQATVIPQLIDQMFHDTRDSRLRLELIDLLNTLPGVTIYFESAAGRRAECAQALGALGPVARQAVPDLLRAVQGSDESLQRPAARALGQIHAEPARVIPVLLACLKGEDDLTEGAAEGLGGFGAGAEVALPRLLELYKIRNKDLHAAVTRALVRIDPDASKRAALLSGGTAPEEHPKIVNPETK